MIKIISSSNESEIVKLIRGRNEQANESITKTVSDILKNTKIRRQRRAKIYETV